MHLALSCASALLAGNALAQTAHHHHHAAMDAGADAGTAPGFQTEMDAGMARMMRDMHGPGYSGNADVDFLVMMIPHHEGAVDMARLVLKHGRDPLTRQLAEEIIASQTIEIESMTRRLALLRQAQSGSSNAASAEFPVLSGTRGD
ncbi:DUF305 domain-containing protein [Comamonas sp. lk]|uniref:CopM family metallochaperone n=1 Tax=Comamonas sp. lk TaxID=2201272 RepID=UPI001F099FB8|nr:DUF305 domain-containing protein [Comamonas sp. lk]